MQQPRTSLRIAAWGMVLGIGIVALGVYGAARLAQAPAEAPPTETRAVRIVADPQRLTTRATTTVAVQAQDGEGRPLDAWGAAPEAWLVRDDLAYATHVQGTRTGSSSFELALHPTQPGSYRLVATDTAGDTVTLGVAALAATGVAEDVPPEELSAGREGYKVVLSAIPDFGRILADEPSALTFTVSRTDVPVAIEERNGYRGSMLALKEGGNLAVYGLPHASAYLPSPSAAAFAVTFPEPGKYRVFFEFAAGGRTYMEARWIEVGAAQ